VLIAEFDHEGLDGQGISAVSAGPDSPVAKGRTPFEKGDPHDISDNELQEAASTREGERTKTAVFGACGITKSTSHWRSKPGVTVMTMTHGGESIFATAWVVDGDSFTNNSMLPVRSLMQAAYLSPNVFLERAGDILGWVSGARVLVGEGTEGRTIGDEFCCYRAVPSRIGDLFGRCDHWLFQPSVFSITTRGSELGKTAQVGLAVAARVASCTAGERQPYKGDGERLFRRVGRCAQTMFTNMRIDLELIWRFAAERSPSVRADIKSVNDALLVRGMLSKRVSAAFEILMSHMCYGWGGGWRLGAAGQGGRSARREGPALFGFEG
jgi:hypothetical protein